MSDSRGGAGRHRARSSEEIRSQIVATRARLAADIDEAREKLSPRGLERQAMSMIRSARREGSGSLGSLSATADRQVDRLSTLAVDTVKRYPLITSLLGIGLALLVFRNGPDRARRRSADRESEQVTPVVTPAARADLPPSGR